MIIIVIIIIINNNDNDDDIDNNDGDGSSFFVTQEEQWYSNTSSGHSSGDTFWSKYHPGIRPSGLSSDSTSVYVDPHILSTPFITDFNGDGAEEELVIVTNFYFEEKR